jgi:hypothetical protein
VGEWWDIQKTMERETKTIICPSGKEAVIKTYLTARERDQIKQDLVGNERIDVNGAQSDFSGAGLIKSQQTLVKILVVSYEGNSENCFDRLYDGKPEDYDFVSEETGKMMMVNLKKNLMPIMNGNVTSESGVAI